MCCLESADTDGGQIKIVVGRDKNTCVGRWECMYVYKGGMGGRENGSIDLWIVVRD